MSEASEEKADCPVCKTSEEGAMVQCDSCARWFHFICVNVSDDIESRDWECNGCATNKTIINAHEKGDGTGVTNESIQNENTGKCEDLNSLRNELMELKKQLCQLQKENLQCRQSAENIRAAEVTTEPTMRAQSNFHAPITSVYDTGNTLTTGAQGNTNARYECMRAQSNFHAPITSVYDTGNTLTTGAQGNTSALYEGMRAQSNFHAPTTGVYDTVNTLTTGAQGYASMQSNLFLPSTHKLTTVNKNISFQGQPNMGAYIDTNYNLNNNLFRQEHDGGGYGGFQGSSMGNGQGTGRQQASHNLTTMQIQARQALPKELPQFSGKPEEWPMFISSYENSTRICGFSDDENLLRLQRALKGKALDYVRSQLLIPALVSDVISTLRTIFGRPEHIINSLLEKVRLIADVNINKLETLITFSLEVKNLTATIVASGLTSHFNNPMLLKDLIQKLPSQMRLDWAMHSGAYSNINLLLFSEWLSTRANAATTIITIPVGGYQHEERRKAHRVGFHEEKCDVASEQRQQDSRKCSACNENHFIVNCGKFKVMSYNDKWNIVNHMKLCRSCLKAHDPKFCKDRRECGENNCTAKHHFMLHKPEQESKDSSENVVGIHIQQTSNVLYRILPITIRSGHATADIYALLDDGSGPTIIEQDVLKKLQLKGKESELRLRWTDGSVRVEENSACISLQVSAYAKNKIYTLCDVRTVSKLDLPPQTLIMPELANKYKHLRGLPVESYQDVVPQMIIGLNNKHVAMPMKFREGKSDEPAATKTRLGWTIYGVLKQSLNENLQLHVCECDDDIALQKLLIECMRHESSDAQVSTLDLKSRFDENQLDKYVQRTGDHFTAKLLWRTNNISLPNNYDMAKRRLECFEKKLSKDPMLKRKVSAHIQDMEEKQYIRKLDQSEIDAYYKRKWYLPIFTVTNPNKPNKTRLVWDAAAAYNGLSLNGCLEKGPDLLRPLTNILYNFRIGNIGICADICEMFHRISVDVEDQHSQRFLWRDCNDERNPDVYVLRVMSFGASCSPSIAQHTRNKNAEEFKKDFPRAAKSIVERHYVDDMLDCADSPEEAIQLAKDVKEVHKRGNFHIRGWVSNCEQLVQALNDSDTLSDFCKAGKVIDQVIEPEKVLGLWWQTGNDVFTFNTKFTKASSAILHNEKLPTKRELLRLLMSIYDPQGFLAFFTVRIKILLQDIWRSGINWDDIIPEEFAIPWRQWLSNLKHVGEVQIPRCYFGNFNRQICRVELHVFVDASELASVAVAYFRIVNNDEFRVALVSSKTKVAPLRPISIPRMELTAGILGSRLACAIVKGHDIEINDTHFYTDSKTVLTWLRSDPRKYKQFVMFRVAEIQENSDISKWTFIPTKLNVADAATKRHTTKEFAPNNVWFTGPEFLCLPQERWPISEIAEMNTNTVREEDNQFLQCALQAEVQPVIDISRFSKWERLEGCMAYVKRFIENCKSKKGTQARPSFKPTNLTADELLWSRHVLYRFAQTDAYRNEIACLRKDPLCMLPKISPLRNLSPVVADDQIVRMRSRIENVPIEDVAKNPIILPRTHKITQLIIDWYHRKYHHVHHDTVINEMFQRFYIPKLRQALRTVRNNCITCKLRKANPTPPEMGPLPKGRLAPYTRPFSYVGIDFFGPFFVTLGRRTEKRYGVLFTCMTCRAIHIEVAHSLNTNSCVMAIRNFVSRRGQPIEIFSDNGTNFIAAEKELCKAYNDIEFNALQAKLTTAECKWTFIPPASPHMGGAWERMIRSVKNVLYNIVTPNTKLTDEKLHNLLLEVESIVNGRPLTYLSLDTAVQEALTPNHFLMGSSSGNKPPSKFESTDAYVKSSWRHSQYLADMFWKRWVAEVLPTLTRRSKWFGHTRSIAEGDVVIIVDPNLPRHVWPKGIVTKVYPGQDGQVRSAIVRTSTGEYHRPAAKLALLDIQQCITDNVA